MDAPESGLCPSISRTAVPDISSWLLVIFGKGYIGNAGTSWEALTIVELRHLRTLQAAADLSPEVTAGDEE